MWGLKRAVLCGVVASVIALICCGCSGVETKADANRPSMFVLVERTCSWDVVYDKETKVMYAVSGDHGFSVLVNTDGTPKIYNEK
jgi:hypothetical protein